MENFQVEEADMIDGLQKIQIKFLTKRPVIEKLVDSPSIYHPIDLTKIDIFLGEPFSPGILFTWVPSVFLGQMVTNLFQTIPIKQSFYSAGLGFANFRFELCQLTEGIKRLGTY